MTKVCLRPCQAHQVQEEKKNKCKKIQLPNKETKMTIVTKGKIEGCHQLILQWHKLLNSQIVTGSRKTLLMATYETARRTTPNECKYQKLQPKWISELCLRCLDTYQTKSWT